MEMASMADIPAGTGLGSSGSFTTALLHALHTYRHHSIPIEELAEQACTIEIDKLAEPVGKQDQYIAAFGGVTCFYFNRNGKVEVQPLRITPQTRYNLEDGLALFFTGFNRRAGSILKEQDDRTKARDAAMIDNLHFIKELGLQSKVALETGDLVRFGEIMDEHWRYKKQRSAGMSNSSIDEWYELGRRAGAIGGKLIGAGGGGFLMFYTQDRPRLRQAMSKVGLQEVRIRFDYEGTKTIAQ